MLRNTCFRCSVLTLAAVMLGGCGARLGEVSGRVTYQGNPLPAGRITFFCEGGSKPVIARPIADGAYTVPGLPVGKARVTIATFQVKQEAPSGPMKSPVPTDVAAPVLGPYVAIPDRYRMPDTSALTVTIDGGRQTQDWELKP